MNNAQSVRDAILHTSQAASALLTAGSGSKVRTPIRGNNNSSINTNSNPGSGVIVPSVAISLSGNGSTFSAPPPLTGPKPFHPQQQGVLMMMGPQTPSVVGDSGNFESAFGGGGGDGADRQLWMGFDVNVHKATHTTSIASYALFSVSSIDLLRELWDSLADSSVPATDASSSPSRGFGGGIVRYMARVLYGSGGSSQRKSARGGGTARQQQQQQLQSATSGTSTAIAGGRGLKVTSQRTNVVRSQHPSSDFAAADDPTSLVFHRRVLSDGFRSVASSAPGSPATATLATAPNSVLNPSRRRLISFDDAQGSVQRERSALLSSCLAPLSPHGRSMQPMVRTDKGEGYGMPAPALNLDDSPADASRTAAALASVENNNNSITTSRTQGVHPSQPGSKGSAPPSSGEFASISSPVHQRRRQRAALQLASSNGVMATAGTGAASGGELLGAPLTISVPQLSHHGTASTHTSPTLARRAAFPLHSVNPPPREPMTPLSPDMAPYFATNGGVDRRHTHDRLETATANTATPHWPTSALGGPKGDEVSIRPPSASFVSPPPNHRTVAFANPMFVDQLMHLESLVEEGGDDVGFDIDSQPGRRREERGEYEDNDEDSNASFVIRSQIGIADTTVPIVVIVEELPPVLPSRRLGLIYTSNITQSALARINGSPSGDLPDGDEGPLFDLHLTFLRNGPDLFRLYPIYDAGAGDETANKRDLYGGVEGISIECGGGPNFNFNKNYASAAAEASIATPAETRDRPRFHKRTFSAASSSSNTTDPFPSFAPHTARPPHRHPSRGLGRQHNVDGGDSVVVEESVVATCAPPPREVERGDTTDTFDGLSEADLCIICFTEQKAVITMPCAHYAVCMVCVKKLKECPICRKPITETLFLLRPVGAFAGGAVVDCPSSTSGSGPCVAVGKDAPPSSVFSAPPSFAADAPGRKGPRARRRVSFDDISGRPPFAFPENSGDEGGGLLDGHSHGTGGGVAPRHCRFDSSRQSDSSCPAPSHAASRRLTNAFQSQSQQRGVARAEQVAAHHPEMALRMATDDGEERGAGGPFTSIVEVSPGSAMTTAFVSNAAVGTSLPSPSDNSSLQEAERMFSLSTTQRPSTSRNAFSGLRIATGGRDAPAGDAEPPTPNGVPTAAAAAALASSQRSKGSAANVRIVAAGDGGGAVMTEQEYVESLLRHLQGRDGNTAGSAAAGAVHFGLGGSGEGLIDGDVSQFSLDDSLRLLVGALRSRLKKTGSFRRSSLGQGSVTNRNAPVFEPQMAAAVSAAATYAPAMPAGASALDAHVLATAAATEHSTPSNSPAATAVSVAAEVVDAPPLSFAYSLGGYESRDDVEMAVRGDWREEPNASESTPRGRLSSNRALLRTVSSGVGLNFGALPRAMHGADVDAAEGGALATAKSMMTFDADFGSVVELTTIEGADANVAADAVADAPPPADGPKTRQVRPAMRADVAARHEASYATALSGSAASDSASSSGVPSPAIAAAVGAPAFATLDAGSGSDSVLHAGDERSGAPGHGKGGLGSSTAVVPMDEDSPNSGLNAASLVETPPALQVRAASIANLAAALRTSLTANGGGVVAMANRMWGTHADPTPAVSGEVDAADLGAPGSSAPPRHETSTD